MGFKCHLKFDPPGFCHGVYTCVIKFWNVFEAGRVLTSSGGQDLSSLSHSKKEAC